MDLASVTAILHEHVDPHLDASALERGAVGNSQETWFVEARGPDGAHQFVLRRSAPGGVLSWTDRQREYDVLAALVGHGLPVPRPYALGLLERPYILMERLPGKPVGRVGPDVASTLARELGMWLARLHRLDAGVLGLALPASSRSATLEEVRRWNDLYYACRPGAVPLLGALLAWAERAVPDDGAPCVPVWGDAGMHNVLADDGHVSALLDWELAHVGHPLEDLGAAVWACLGRFDPADVVAGYESVWGPVDCATLDYYVALAALSRTVMLVNGVVAWLESSTPAPSLAGLALDLTAFSLALAAEAAGWGRLPAADDAPARMPLRPSPAETIRGLARWLASELAPEGDDRRRRRMVRAAAALLEATANRLPGFDDEELERIEAEAVAAERAGGDADLRQALLADLAREWRRLEPLTLLHGHPRPWAGDRLR